MIIDTECTGLNTKKDEIVQLAFNLIEFDTEGNFYKVLYQYSSLQETQRKFHPKAALITNLNNEKLKGHSIDKETLKNLLEKTDVVIAFNASFDRPMLERFEPLFQKKYFACALEEIPYLELYGFGGSQELLLQKICNVYYGAHDALMDVNALTYLLSQKAPNSDKTLFYVLMKMSQASKTRVHIITEDYLDGDYLREKDFRYSPNTRIFYKDVKDSELQETIDFIESLGAKAQTQVLNGFNKFR